MLFGNITFAYIFRETNKAVIWLLLVLGILDPHFVAEKHAIDLCDLESSDADGSFWIHSLT